MFEALKYQRYVFIKILLYYYVNGFTHYNVYSCPSFEKDLYNIYNSLSRNVRRRFEIWRNVFKA